MSHVRLLASRLLFVLSCGLFGYFYYLSCFLLMPILLLCILCIIIIIICSILSMVVPIYNAELSPSGLRGRLVSLNQLAITAGIMVSFVADLLAARYW